MSNVYGPTQSPALNAPQAEAQRALMWFKALSLHFPRRRIRRLFCGQLSDGFWRGSYFDQAMRYVDTAGIIQAGASFYTRIDEVRVAPYARLATSAEPDGRGVLHHQRLKNIDWRNMSDAQIDALLANSTRMVEALMRSFFAYLGKLRADLPRSTYE